MEYREYIQRIALYRNLWYLGSCMRVLCLISEESSSLKRRCSKTCSHYQRYLCALTGLPSPPYLLTSVAAKAPLQPLLSPHLLRSVAAKLLCNHSLPSLHLLTRVCSRIPFATTAAFTSFIHITPVLSHPLEYTAPLIVRFIKGRTGILRSLITI